MRSDSLPSARPELPVTSWAIVHQTGLDTVPGRRALGQLYRDYWEPMVGYLCCRGFSREDAEDLVSSFFHRSMANGFFRRAKPDRGRFRSFLLVSLKNYAAEQMEKAQTKKRGGDLKATRLDWENTQDQTADQSEGIDPEKEFDRQWALTLLTRTLDQLQLAFLSDTGQQRFQWLRPHLEPGADAPSYAETAERLGITESHARVMVYRLRQRFREVLQQEVAQTLADPQPEAVKEELESLLAVF